MQAGMVGNKVIAVYVAAGDPELGARDSLRCEWMAGDGDWGRHLEAGCTISSGDEMRKVGTKETQVSSSRDSLGHCGNRWMNE